MARKVLIFSYLLTGCCECEECTVFLGSEELESNHDLAQELAIQAAEACEENDPEWDHDLGNVDHEIYYYDPQKHDRLRAGGGSFLDEYPTARQCENKGYFFIDNTRPIY